jgi:hypothetical protein
MKTYKHNNTKFNPMKINKISIIKDRTMKYLLTLSLASLLLFFGCDQGSDLTSPINDSPTKQFKLISIPAPAGGLSIESQITSVKEIDGEEGGTFWAFYLYQSEESGYVYCHSKLVFPEDAFDGEQLISQTLDTEFAAMTYGPSMQFDMPVECDLKYVGLDLTDVDPNTLDFVYIDDTGSIEHVEYDEITMDASKGKIEVKNAVLTHFSRYGFVNDQE